MLPNGMRVHTSDDGAALMRSGYRSDSPAVTGALQIERRWLATPKVRREVAVYTVFLLFWFGFLTFWYALALGGDAPLVWSVFAALFPLLHVGVGLWLAYTVLTKIFNTSIITADAQSLTIHHGPLPVRGNKRIPVAAIEQLYCKEVQTTVQNEGSSPTTIIEYSVLVRVQGGREIPLVENLPEPDQAQFIEQQLEAYLHITDTPVDGEL